MICRHDWSWQICKFRPERDSNPWPNKPSGSWWVRNIPAEDKEYKWIYEISYICTAENDTKIWLIIAVLWNCFRTAMINHVFISYSAVQIYEISYIEDITCPLMDMNFIFEWSTRYLTSERSERVRYRVDHSKIKFISISGHVIFCLLYKHQWNTKPFYFNIFNGLKVERVVTKHGRSTWTKTKFIW